MKRLLYIAVILLWGSVVYAQGSQQKQDQEVKRKDRHRPEPYAWRISQPLGDRYRVPIDTAFLNLYQDDLPSSHEVANGYTGTLGSPALSKIFFTRPETPEFMFIAPYWRQYVTPDRFSFYNSKIPITYLSYFTGGKKAYATDRLEATFSGNVNEKLAFGGAIDYILSRGYYDRQGTKDMSYQLFGSYIGDRYEIQALASTVNFVQQENGGITNDDYILRPEDMQGGQGSFDTRNVPVNLPDAYNRVRGKLYYATQRYNLGYEKEVERDTTIDTLFIPVSSIIHTIQYTDNRRRFISTVPTTPEGGTPYFSNNYFSDKTTNDTASWWSLQNTIGLSLREGFSKYAKTGLAAYVTHEFRRYTDMGDTLAGSRNEQGLYERTPKRKTTDNLLWVGAQITKTQGKILTYDIDGKLGIAGTAIGSIDVKGGINTRFPILKDTVLLRAYGFFRNTEPSHYLKKYASNHFIWNNDFGKERRFRVGGEFAVPRWGTRVNVGVENLQNYIYFNNQSMPQQESSMIQVFSATLDQKIKLGIFNWDNEIVYQKSSKPDILPLPDLSIYSNMYLLFKIAKVLHVQLGVDCRYFTKYYSEAYQPATLTFHTQDQLKIGNYPLMNAYIDCKLKNGRFFLLFSHVNQGMFNYNGYFALPHYPVNPRAFQVGIALDFTN